MQNIQNGQPANPSPDAPVLQHIFDLTEGPIDIAKMEKKFDRMAKRCQDLSLEYTAQILIGAACKVGAEAARAGDAQTVCDITLAIRLLVDDIMPGALKRDIYMSKMNGATPKVH